MKNSVITLTLCLLLTGIYSKHLWDFEDWKTSKLLYKHKSVFFKNIESQSRMFENKKQYRVISKTSVLPWILSWNQEVNVASMPKKNWVEI